MSRPAAWVVQLGGRQYAVAAAFAAHYEHLAIGEERRREGGAAEDHVPRGGPGPVARVIELGRRQSDTGLIAITVPWSVMPSKQVLMTLRIDMTAPISPSMASFVSRDRPRTYCHGWSNDPTQFIASGQRKAAVVSARRGPSSQSLRFIATTA
jgi:hypothetical protein